MIFLTFCLISLFFSINLSESIVVLSRWLTFFCFVLLLYFYVNDLKINYLSTLIVLFLTFQLYFTFSGYLNIISLTEYDFSFAPYLLGLTGNKNITATLFAMEAPFVLYLIFFLKRPYLKLLFSILLSLTFYNIFVLGSRTAILITLFQSIFLVFFIIFHTKFNLKSKINHILFWIFPLVVSFFIFNNSLKTSSTSNIYNRLSTIELEDTSVNTRFRYYKHSIEYILENPFTPLGIGNWKIESINWDRLNINGYTVPYHAHNDFLELATEITVFGVFFYLLIFIFSFYDSLKKIRNLSSKTSIMFLPFLMSGLAFFIDSFFNFPHARVIQLLIFGLSISKIIILKHNTNE